MATFFIFHGVGGHPHENWFHWLKTELEKEQHQVIVPQFPTPQNQTLEAWMEVLEEYKQLITPETTLIGHSLGVPFALSVIEHQPIKAAFFVAGFVGKTGNHFDESMKTFAQKDFNWENIHEHCKQFVIYHSNNDPYIPMQKAEELGKLLNTQPILVPYAGHFGEEAGYTRFEMLLKKIKGL